jgi:small ubiquitin-related modifier
VQDQAGLISNFLLLPTTPLEKLFNAYAARLRMEPGALRWLYDGQRIAPHATPKAMGIEDNDVLHVMVEQIGGAM